MRVMINIRVIIFERIKKCIICVYLLTNDQNKNSIIDLGLNYNLSYARQLVTKLNGGLVVNIW